jgi:hypothetical protein
LVMGHMMLNMYVLHSNVSVMNEMLFVQTSISYVIMFEFWSLNLSGILAPLRFIYMGEWNG